MSLAPHPREARAIIQEGIEAKKFLQKDFAKATGIPAATLSMFLSGQRKPSIPLLEKCAEKLDLDIDELLQAQKTFEAWSQSAEGKRALTKELQLQSPDRRSSGALANWQIKLHLDLDELKIEPVDKAELKLASLDLTRGKYKMVSRDLRKTFSDREKLLLGKGESALIYSKQKLTLPMFLAGRAGGISFYLAQGIMVSFGLQLDPGFSGHPFALFPNNGAEPYAIEPGEPCLSVEFYYLAGEPDEELEGPLG